MFDSILNLRQPMKPEPSQVVSQLQLMPAVRAVVFDVYGTLVISGSGDVGSADSRGHDTKIRDALLAAGLVMREDRVPTTKELHEIIQRLNDARRGENCPKPEVDIVEAWRQLLSVWDIECRGSEAKSIAQVAAEYESRANPTWPMPQSAELLGLLREAGMPLGIVSNAQVFTPCLVENLLDGKSLSDGGFDLDLCVFSNRFRQAKPGPRLFDVLRAGLKRRGIQPHEALYVGNDMLNDVWAASQAGLRTAWFAGDARSCRRREDDPRCRSLRPDLVVTELMELLECVELK